MTRLRTAILVVGVTAVLTAAYVLSKDDDSPNTQNTSSVKDQQEQLLSAVENPFLDEHIVANESGSVLLPERTTNDAFRFLDSDELDRIVPAIDEKFFSGESDGTYLRYIVLEIDTEMFKSQLQKAWVDAESSDSDVFVTVPMSERLTAEILVKSWINHPSGIVAGYGDSLIDGVRLRESAQVYFSPDGNMRLSVSSSDSNFNFTFVRDYSTYVVMETRPIQRID